MFRVVCEESREFDNLRLYLRYAYKKHHCKKWVISNLVMDNLRMDLINDPEIESLLKQMHINGVEELTTTKREKPNFGLFGGKDNGRFDPSRKIIRITSYKLSVHYSSTPCEIGLNKTVYYELTYQDITPFQSSELPTSSYHDDLLFKTSGEMTEVGDMALNFNLSYKENFEIFKKGILKLIRKKIIISLEKFTK